MGFWVLYFNIVLQVTPLGSGCCTLTLCCRLHPWVLGAVLLKLCCRLHPWVMDAVF